MPHIIDFDSIEQKLFTLQHVCYGSRRFCEQYKIDRGATDAKEYEWWEYYGILKTIVSTTMIEAAIKLRMVQDFIGAEQEDANLADLDRDAVAGLHIGRFVEGTGNLTLRESCNKLVHATEAKLQWADVQHGGDTVEYWTGTYRLWGSKNGNSWHVEIEVAAWSAAMIRLNKAVQESADWSSVSKWDE